MRRLPNLNQLRAFEAAVRRGSFKAGAEELNVTQAAVSHQIKALEDSLGLALFKRGPREAIATPEAKDYAAALGTAFESMRRATEKISVAPETPIRLSVAPFHGNRWLVPLLAEFHAAHPGIVVEPSLSFDMIDLEGGDFDAAIRFGHGDWPEFDIRFVHDDRQRPVATRSLIGDRRLPLSPEEIAALPLLADAAHLGDWEAWFRAAGYAGHVPVPKVYEARPYVVDAVMSGHGAHLLDVRLTARNVADGQLIYLSDIESVTDMGYYMVRSRSARPDPRIDILADWLAKAARAS